MPDFTVAPTPWPSRDQGGREYLFDMLQQLAKLARGSGEVPIAILLEAILAAASAAREASG